MSYPGIVTKNQFGEQSNSLIIGGTSQINCTFVVDSSNANGLGINSLLGIGVASIFMHTSATPLAGNPNPAVGYIVAKLNKAHAGYQSGTFSLLAPLSGSSVNVTSGLTQFAVYTIVTLGTSTQANFVALGLPAGITAAPGVSFVASTASAGTGTGTVQLISAAGSTLGHIELVGNPNVTCNPTDGTGSQLFMVCLGATSTSVTTLIAKAPADGTLITLTFNMLRNPLPLI